jgi:hypothetical protein
MAVEKTGTAAIEKTDLLAALRKLSRGKRPPAGGAADSTGRTALRPKRDL